ncbi:uncharacterized protein LOC124914256 [Impatiens glandulifera]|uniref:uncharacterized protein LOC124914256 n=1 Tax=Impatiens glandulifera TaxID=253017 RepID=UPI001FB04FB8|nr:uncharacterized protein LOC124914256 [Impatiens glandulifera]
MKDNGCADDNLASMFASLTVSDANHNDDGLFQVMKAVEAAEITIKQQADENTRLRNELHKKIQELHKYEQVGDRHIDSSVVGNEGDVVKRNAIISEPSVVVIPSNVRPDIGDVATPSHPGIHYESNKLNGILKQPSANQTPSTSFPLNRYQIDGGYNQHLSSTLNVLMPVTESSSSILKQDLYIKIHEHEEEILQLQKHLADYSIKEAQVHNEKNVLEKRIAYMRAAFDQQQQDLVDAASKAISYRQDIIEENIRLTYALQRAQQERSTFVSSFVPLLAEYSLHPQVLDAQSIVSNVKVLFKHLHEKLIITDEKLKESQYQLAPWGFDMISNSASQSPSNHVGLVLTPGRNRLELVPQPAYSSGNMLNTSETQTMGDWEAREHQIGRSDSDLLRHLEPDDDLVKYSPHASRNIRPKDLPVQFTVNHRNPRPVHNFDQTTTNQVTFNDPAGINELDDVDANVPQNVKDSAKWSSHNSPYTTSLEEPNSSYSPYLPPVLEEHSTSLSEAGDDDPLPAIQDLQISGEAFPGQELQASGYSINGTTTCNFEWVRHLEDGSVNYIDGAKQPNYLVNADDVGTYLAIEVQPLDDRKRKGELVRVFANEHRKITCDREMLRHIEKTLYTGGASYRVSLSTVYLDIWEQVILTIKKDGYSIKSSGSGSISVSEKFSSITDIIIPCGHPIEFSIVCSSGVEHVLRADNNSSDISCSRDTIVITLRLFIMRANEKKKGKKKSLFFKR